MIHHPTAREALRKTAEFIFMSTATLVVKSPSIIGTYLKDLDISMPNLETPTLGGPVWWDTIQEHRGWRLQRNKLTHHYRILDPSDYRKAWGGEKMMRELFEALLEFVRQ